MQIFLNIKGETQVLQVAEGLTVSELKQQIAVEQQIEGDINLVVSGEQLCGFEIVSEKATEDAQFFLNLDLLGGKKKKKKKSYTTKKKNKHKHKKTKLHVLSYFDTAGKGDMKLQRRQCPECPAGTYMAKHWDRHYCGLCHITLKIDKEIAQANWVELQKKLAAKKIETAKAEAAAPAAAGKGGKGKKKK